MSLLSGVRRLESKEIYDARRALGSDVRSFTTPDTGCKTPDAFPPRQTLYAARRRPRLKKPASGSKPVAASMMLDGSGAGAPKKKGEKLPVCTVIVS